MLYFPRWKVALIVLISVLGVLYAVPNLLPKQIRENTPDWLPHKTVHLGLDLQGGSHVLLEVDEKDLFKNLAEPLLDDIRLALRKKPRISYKGLRQNGKTVVVRILKPENMSSALSRIRKLSRPVSSGVFGNGGTAKDFEVTADGNLITVNFTKPSIQAKTKKAIKQAIEIIRRRIDALGTTEPTIQQQGNDRILVQVPGLKDPERLKTILGETAVLRFRLLCDTQPDRGASRIGRPPPGCQLRYSRDEPKIPYFVKTSRRATVEGENLVDAQPGFDQRTNEPIVTFRFNRKGGVRFADLTRKNVNKPFAIILDDKVLSAPVIREPILGGSGQISGNFSVQEVNDLSLMLRAGALPVKLDIIEERTVGPGLGADSIAAGKIASVIGLVAVVVYILVSYGLFGVFANIALMINIGLIIGVLSLLQATLTLPGIAGIVLTIGMAVDANVLIFERIREEMRMGKTPIAAIDTGYSRALGTILDANITTFIAAVILFQMGSGPVRGFAVTLAIGIVTSVFTAFTLTRLFVAWWVHSKRPKTVPL